MNNIYSEVAKENNILLKKPDKYSLNLNFESKRPIIIENKN